MWGHGQAAVCRVQPHTRGSTCLADDMAPDRGSLGGRSPLSDLSACMERRPQDECCQVMTHHRSALYRSAQCFKAWPACRERRGLLHVPVSRHNAWCCMP